MYISSKISIPFIYIHAVFVLVTEMLQFYLFISYDIPLEIIKSWCDTVWIYPDPLP